MKKTFIFLLTVLCLAFFMPTKAQTNLVPNNSFENWSTGQGYSVSILSVYSNYQYPDDWNYLTYPVNETVNLGFFTLNINTDIPLLKANVDTNAVPNGQKALILTSFKLSDIVSSTAYSLANSMIDSSLLNMVFPTVLTTGELNLDNFMNLYDVVMGIMDNEAALISTLATLDINEYVNGGIALNGFIPSQLTGNYKYTSAVSGDNGGVIFFGTKYNTATGRREVVGGGGRLNFADVASYQPFTINYSSLHEIDPSFAEITPDTLVIALISSATMDRQQGSMLYIDNLNLVEAIPEIETCASITGLRVTSVDTMSATLKWDNVTSLYEVEYGPHGFAIGEGTELNAFTNSFTINNLQPDTEYDFHVRAVCGDDLFGNWSWISFKTDTLVPPVEPIDTITPTPPTPPSDSTGICDFSELGISVYPNPAQGFCHVHFGQLIPDMIQVYSIFGKLVESVQPTQESILINLPSKGIFILKINTLKGTYYKKIINR